MLATVCAIALITPVSTFSVDDSVIIDVSTFSTVSGRLSLDKTDKSVDWEITLATDTKASEVFWPVIALAVLITEIIWVFNTWDC